jgi:methylase of polypeptide subunit release factors
LSKEKFRDLTSVDTIFDFFENSGYTVELDQFSFPLSELLDKEIEGEFWTVIDQPDLTVLIVKSDLYNRKSYRSKVNNYLKDLIEMKIVFYTEDFTHYNLTLIYNGVYNTKFDPSDLEMAAVRVLESIENKEELMGYTEQDVDFTLLKRKLTADSLIDAIKTEENSVVKIAFHEGGLNLIGKGKDKIIISHEDAPISDMVVDIKLDYKKEKISEEDLNSISSFYQEETRKNLKLIALITKEGLLYHWCNYKVEGFIKYINEIGEDVKEDVLESLIAQVSHRTAFNSETFHQQFGSYSPFFILGLTLFEEYMRKEHEKIDIMYEEWKSRFSKVYQSGDLDKELFLKHSYLSLLVKIVLISKFLPETEELASEDSIEILITIFEERGIPIFMNDFFQWSIEENNVQKEILIPLEDASFIVDDIFRTIYQEMVSPATRHALGEFFTPPPLARKMVEEAYSVGEYVLDPACGSGTFLVEILNFIENANIKSDKKIAALSRIYGFDVNPIAVLVSRSNLLLLTDKLFKSAQKIPINVFLTDSLNPIDEFQKTVKDKKANKEHKIRGIEQWSDFGEIERFNMPAIDDSLIINKKFFKYPEKFGLLLKELDKHLSKGLEFEKLLKKIYESIDDTWLNEICEGTTTNKNLRDNFKYIAKKFYNYVKKDKNHIWAYLLYNAIGVRKMQETIEGVDLIIGNPPWLTIADIMSHEYKNQIKNISKDLGIYEGGKQSPHVEICSIFFYRTSELYLRKNGKIFFVTPATIETGDQHSKFRIFKNFKNIFLWKFFGEDIFNVHNVCVGGEYGNQTLKQRLKIDVYLYKSTKENKKWHIELKDKDVYVPYNYDNISNKEGAKRLVTISNKKEIFPIKDSYYLEHFNQGASLVPRNLLFIRKLKDGSIVPDKSLLQKEPWDFYPSEDYDFEDRYIFKIVKSTEIVPFNVLEFHDCFLPIEREDYCFHKQLIKPKAKTFFKRVSKIYRKIQKEKEKSITNLWKRINYNNGVSNPQQKSKIKVIYNASGSILKSSVIENEVIVDTTLFYMGTENIGEAYYLCSVLNSNCLTRQIEHMGTTGASGSIRHIHKRPLSFPIPQFNEMDDLHIKIADLGKNCERRVKKIIKNLKKKKVNRLRKRIRCLKCGKTYSKRTFNRYRKGHEQDCDGVDSDYKWSDDDWKDLKEITAEDIQLSRMKTQNVIFDDEKMKEKLEELDELVIELLTSQGDQEDEQ